MGTTLAATLLGCSAGGGGTPTESFCSRLVSGAGCGGERTNCPDRIGVERGRHPECAARLDPLLRCLAGLALTCAFSNDSFVDANGDTTAAPNFVLQLPVYEVRIRDTACLALANDYANCTNCGSAVGSGTDLGGIGDPCADSSTCAPELQCMGGACTRSCSASADCAPRHGVVGECTTSSGHITACDHGMCAPYCRSGSSISRCAP